MVLYIGLLKSCCYQFVRTLEGHSLSVYEDVTESRIDTSKSPYFLVAFGANNKLMTRDHLGKRKHVEDEPVTGLFCSEPESIIHFFF